MEEKWLTVVRVLYFAVSDLLTLIRRTKYQPNNARRTGFKQVALPFVPLNKLLTSAGSESGFRSAANTWRKEEVWRLGLLSLGQRDLDRQADRQTGRQATGRKNTKLSKWDHSRRPMGRPDGRSEAGDPWRQTNWTRWLPEAWLT